MRPPTLLPASLTSIHNRDASAIYFLMLQAISRRLRRPHCGSSSFTIPSRCRDRRLSLWPRRSHQPSSRRIIPPPPGDFPFKYWVIDNVENLELYTAGGLHPVWLDDILHDRYQIVDKLGYGGNSTVWLGHDLLEKRYVALKIGRSAKISDADEAATIRQLSTFQKGSINQAGGLIPAILDEFSIHGPNGTHQCLVTKPMEGSLRQAKGYGALFPMPVARVLVARLCLAVQFVHSRGFVHGGVSYLVVWLWAFANDLIQTSTSVTLSLVSLFLLTDFLSSNSERCMVKLRLNP